MWVSCACSGAGNPAFELRSVQHNEQPLRLAPVATEGRACSTTAYWGMLKIHRMLLAISGQF